MKKGIACILFSAFGFALMVMFARLADELGSPLPAAQKAFFRNAFAAMVAGGAVAVQAFGRSRNVRAEERIRLPRGWGEWMDIVLRATLGTAGIVTHFYALSHMPIGDAFSLNKTAPFFTLLACRFMLGEKLSKRQFLCVCGAFVGAMLVVKPGFAGGFGLPAFLALISGACAGSAYGFLHRLGKHGVTSSFIILFFSVFSCLACVPLFIFHAEAMNGAQLAALIATGLCGAMGQFGITMAYRFAEPRQIAVYDYSGIFFSALLGFLVFGQVPDGFSFVGFALIALMGWAVTRR